MLPVVFPSSSSATSSAVSHRFSALLESPAFRIWCLGATFSRVSPARIPVQHPQHLLESPSRVFGLVCSFLLPSNLLSSSVRLLWPIVRLLPVPFPCRLWLGNYERSWIKRTGRKGSQHLPGRVHLWPTLRRQGHGRSEAGN